jgi:hypothetical protein
MVSFLIIFAALLITLYNTHIYEKGSLRTHRNGPRRPTY